jgi:hypothetical protein
MPKASQHVAGGERSDTTGLKWKYSPHPGRDASAVRPIHPRLRNSMNLAVPDAFREAFGSRWVPRDSGEPSGAEPRAPLFFQEDFVTRTPAEERSFEA